MPPSRRVPWVTPTVRACRSTRSRHVGRQGLISAPLFLPMVDNVVRKCARPIVPAESRRGCCLVGNAKNRDSPLGRSVARSAQVLPRRCCLARVTALAWWSESGSRHRVPPDALPDGECRGAHRQRLDLVPPLEPGHLERWRAQVSRVALLTLDPLNPATIAWAEVAANGRLRDSKHAPEYRDPPPRFPEARHWPRGGGVSGMRQHQAVAVRVPHPELALGTIEGIGH